MEVFFRKLHNSGGLRLYQLLLPCNPSEGSRLLPVRKEGLGEQALLLTRAWVWGQEEAGNWVWSLQCAGVRLSVLKG